VQGEHEFLDQEEQFNTIAFRTSRCTISLAISLRLRYVRDGRETRGVEEIIEIRHEEQIFKVINDAAMRYKGIIPDDRWHEPYMPIDEVRREMKRMSFFGYMKEGELLGVVGKEPVKDTTLIRHLYVLTKAQGKGVGSKLLDHVQSAVTTEYLLIGTWQAAHWATAFYKKHGFEPAENKDDLLRKYWDIPDRQIETSCVLRKKMR
jgi:GNAT superfamily N-acetyltransferase